MSDEKDNAGEIAGGHDHDRKIEIEVNGRAVIMHEDDATGAEIKKQAIKQGVSIQINFVLQLEQANGTSKVIGDKDKIRLHKRMSFTAIAADDNS